MEELAKKQDAKLQAEIEERRKFEEDRRLHKEMEEAKKKEETEIKIRLRKENR